MVSHCTVYTLACVLCVCAVNNSVAGVLQDQNAAFRGLTLVGGGIFVHVGGTSAVTDARVSVMDVVAAGNHVGSQYNVNGGGVMTVISSGSEEVAMSSIDLTNVTVTNNTGTAMLCYAGCANHAFVRL